MARIGEQELTQEPNRPITLASLMRPDGRGEQIRRRRGGRGPNRLGQIRLPRLNSSAKDRCEILAWAYRPPENHAAG
jgi:hypothetical protein